jgi:hypothetical protein
MAFIRAVRNSTDLQRIRSLPRRTLTLEGAREAAARYTAELALSPDVQLRPWQGCSLDEAVRGEPYGAWLSLPVGQGKTLIAETLPVVLASRKAVLIIPASLKEKTFADRASYRGKWRTMSPPPRIISREELALDANAYLLEQIDPDLILIDESDELSNLDKGAPKRVHRYVTAKRAAGGVVRVVAMTGTPTRRSIMGYWHLLLWCRGDLAPVPLTKLDAELWAAALDDASPRQGFRPNPGALGATIEEARMWYLDRLRETPGVVIVDEDSAADVPLTIEIDLAPDCPVIDEAFYNLRTFWTSPSGEEVSDPLSLLRIEGQLGCGLVTYFDPPPPLDWADARRTFAKYVRERISATQHARKPLDTEKQVVSAHPEAAAVREWMRVRDNYRPEKHSRVRWLSDVTLQWAAEWLLCTSEPSVLWCGGVEFADRLSKLTRLPYYGPKGKEVRSGRELHAADPKRSMICSWHANKRGFNLQAWRRNAIIQPPQSAKYLEQVFGRAHRGGQTEPVRFTILATSGGTLDSFAAAISEAHFARDTAGSTQKILRAELAPLPEPPDTLRWATKEEE